MKRSMTKMGHARLALLYTMTLACSVLYYGHSWADDSISPPSAMNNDITPSDSTPTNYTDATPASPASTINPAMPSSSTSSASSNNTTSTNTNSTGSSTSGLPMVSSSGEVIVEPDASLSQLPHIRVGQGTSIVQVLNPSPNRVIFTSSGLNLSVPVPANSQRTVQITPIMAANLTPGQEVAYSVNDTNGNTLASSSFVNTPNTMLASQETNTTATSEQYNESPNQPSTSENSTPASSNTGRSAVRGYW